MSDRNEVRVSDRDPEMLAIKAVAAALEPLDENGRKRVLSWADDRFLRSPLRAMSDAAIEGMRQQLASLEDHAKSLGVRTRDLVHAYSALRQSEGLAPADERSSDPDKLRQTEAKLASKTKA